MSYEAIGKLAVEARLRDSVRIEARKELARAFEQHVCVAGHNVSNYHEQPSCYHSTSNPEGFCEHCKITQPIYGKYLKTSRECAAVKTRLTLLIKKQIAKEVIAPEIKPADNEPRAGNE